MFKIGQRVKLVAPRTRSDMMGAIGEIVGILYSEPVQYHIVYEGFEGSFRSTADQLEAYNNE